jgi:hypothetical protein
MADLTTLLSAYLQELVAQGALPTGVVDTTSVGNVDAGEDTLITYTVPANLLNANGDSLEIIWNTPLAANANSKTTKVYLNDVTGTVVAGRSATDNGGSRVHVVRVVRTAADTVISYGLTHNGPTATTIIETDSVTITLSSSWVIACTAEAVATNDITSRLFMVRYMPVPSYVS